MRWLSALLLMVAGYAADALSLDPPLQRLDLAPSDIVEVMFTLRAAPGTTVTAVAVDCACIHLLTALPAAVPPSGQIDLRLRVTGMRPGVEDVLVATNIGVVRAQLQVVGPAALGAAAISCA